MFEASENIPRVSSEKKTNPLRSLVERAGQDIGSTFINLGVFTPKDTKKLISSTSFIVLPFQALAIGIKGAMAINEESPLIKKSPDISKKEWQAIEIIRGFFTSLATGGFRDRALDRAYISLIPCFSSLLIIIAANPSALPLTLSLAEILTLLQSPYKIYHEMCHQTEDYNFDGKYGTRFSETLTDYWVRIATEGKSHPLSRYVATYANLPFTSFLGWPSVFDRTEVDLLVELLGKKAGGKKEALQLLASGYTGKGNNFDLLRCFDEYTNGHGERVIGILNKPNDNKNRREELKYLFGEAPD